MSSSGSLLHARIESDYLAAYKARDQVHLDVLRLLKTAIKMAQVELKRPVQDGELLVLIQKQAKQRQDAIEQFTAASRHDLAEKEQAELKILQAYLPEPLSAAELASAIETAITDTAATGIRDMGKVMNLLMERCQGRVDGKQLSQAVKTRLQ